VLDIGLLTLLLASACRSGNAAGLCTGDLSDAFGIAPRMGPPKRSTSLLIERNTLLRYDARPSAIAVVSLRPTHFISRASLEAVFLDEDERTQLEACCSNRNLDVVRKAVPLMPRPVISPFISDAFTGKKPNGADLRAVVKKACERRMGYVSSW
jgi:hypothetical protein